MNQVLLHAVGVSKTFDGLSSEQPITLFSDVHLSLHEGEMIAIMGPSGEGKSTLLHILGTLEPPSHGELFIDRHRISGNSYTIRNRTIGFVFQNFHLLTDYTVLQNILFPAWIGRESIASSSPKMARAMDLLRQIGLVHKKDALVHLLSGGEKQRVAIARALCNDPKIILADEPSGNLDYANSEVIHQLFVFCAKKLHKGVIIVTHDMHLANLCDRIFLLEKSTLTEVQSTR